MNKPLKILYSSILHGVLEHDDLLIFKRAGLRFFSLGDYWSRDALVSDVRAFNPDFYDDELLQAFARDPGCSHETKRVSPEFCQLFDVIVISGVESWMRDNWESFGNIPIVYRTIGQSDLPQETKLLTYKDRIKIVRYSPCEVGLPGFASTNEVIYFGKDTKHCPEWVGGGAPITFHSHYRERERISSPGIADYVALVDGFQATLHGLNQPDVPNYKGHLHYSEQDQALAHASCYVYVWSQPPSYTLSFIEAMIIGTPIVAPSAAFIARSSPDPAIGWTPARYEVPQLLSDGCGMIFDTIQQGREAILRLMEGGEFAKQMSNKARARARVVFDIDTIASQWAEFLTKLTQQSHTSISEVH